MPYYAELARVTLEAGDQSALTGLRAVVYATPRGYICTAETFIDNKAWLNKLLSGYRIQAMPKLGAADIYVVGVVVAQTMSPLEIIEQFRAILPDGMEQTVSIGFLLGDAPDDRARAERAIVADFVTEESLGAEQHVLTTGGRAIVLTHGHANAPAASTRFWLRFADALQKTGLCEQVVATEGDVSFVLTESAASTMLPSLLAIASEYPL